MCDITVRWIIINYVKNYMKYSDRWFQFIKERFDPLPYSVMIFVFLGAHYAVYLNFLKQGVASNFGHLLYLIPLILAVFLFFFKLRLFDEIKDIESDAIHHPERPLPRGILRKDDIIRAVFIIIALELLLFSLYGLRALASAVIAVGYSLVMYKEFFSKKWLRAHLTLYAVTHTFVAGFSLIFLSSVERRLRDRKKKKVSILIQKFLEDLALCYWF